MSTSFQLDARFFERFDQGEGVSPAKPGATVDAN
jgi:hypothetical protein